MTFELDNGSHPADFLRLVDEATARMSEKERVAFHGGISLANRYAARLFTDAITHLKNATPDLLRGPVTIRRTQF